jgi:hypothetical protein
MEGTIAMKDCERAYRLIHDGGHLVDMSYDIDLIEWPGVRIKDIPFYSKDAIAPLPTPMEFLGNFHITRTSDFPVARPRDVLVMSPRMLGVLKRVGDFDHAVHPVRLYCDQEAIKHPSFDEYRQKASESAIDDRFVFVQLASYVDAFDWTRSVCKRMERFPELACEIDRFVMRNDVTFPPIFRLSAFPYAVFASAAAREAAEAAGLRGLSFEPYWFGHDGPE